MSAEPLLSAEERGEEPPLTRPEDEASCPNLAMFYYIGPHLIWPAERRGHVGAEDLPEMSAVDEPDVLEAAMWNRIEFLRRGGHRVRLWLELLRLCWRPMLQSGLLFVVSLLGALATPLLLERLLALVEGSAEPLSSLGWGRWDETYAVAVGMYVSSAVGSLAIHNAWYIGQRAGYQAQTMLSGAVFRKVTRLSSVARRRQRMGRIVNLLSLDAARIADRYFAPFVHWATWYSGSQFAVGASQLVRLLGWPAGVGLGVMALFLSLVTANAEVLRRVRKALQKHQDARGDATAEILASIRSVRAAGWTLDATARLLALRAREVAALLRVEIFVALSSLLSGLAGSSVSTVAFPVLVLTLHQPLTASAAFASLVWIDMCRSNLRMLPNFIRGAATVQVSLSRLEDFLTDQEVSEDIVGDVLTVGKEEDMGDRSDFLDTSNSLNSAAPVPKTTSRPHKQDSAAISLRAMDEEPSLPSMEPDELGIYIRNADISWPVAEGEEGDPAKLTAEEGASKLSEEDVAPVRLTQVLKNVNLVCRPGLTVLYGPQGGGKSTVLAALARDAVLKQGSLKVVGSMAFVSQRPWILNRTVRENITFVSPFRRDWFDTVVEACGLGPDIASFTDKEDTVIGDQGITVSGGQRQRLSLARALYADRKVYVLDDILSAVDAHMAEHLFNRAVLQLLVRRGKVVLLATHHMRFVRHAAVLRCFCVRDGGVHLEAPTATDDVLEEDGADSGTADTTEEKKRDDDRIDTPKTEENNTTTTTTEKDDATDKKPSDQDEVAAKGRTHYRHLRRYINACGLTTLVGVVLLLVFATLLSNVVVRWWLKEWVSAPGCADGSTSSVCAPLRWMSEDLVPKSMEAREGQYAGIYAALTIVASLLSSSTSFIVAFSAISAATTLHEELVVAVMNAPMRFFDVNPVGRVQNRMQKDQATVDTTVYWSLLSVSVLLIQTAATLSVMTSSSPWALLAAAAMAIPAARLARGYRIVKRDLRRVRSIARSPVFSNFGEVLRGSAVVRAFGVSEFFERRHQSLMRVFVKASMFSMATDQWVTVWLEQLAALVVGAVLMLVVHEAAVGEASAATVGFVISFAMDLPGQFLWLLRNGAWSEAELVAVERLGEYIEETDEADVVFPHAQIGPVQRPSEDEHQDILSPARHRLISSGSSPAAMSSPNGGGLESHPLLEGTAPLMSLSMRTTDERGAAVQIRDVFMRYSASGPEILRGVNLSIARGAKVAIVGRTGSGKSTLAACLAGLYTYEGSIIIDDDEASVVGTDAIRTHMSVIPQDGSLFAGTVRDNLIGWHTTPELTVEPACTNTLYRRVCAPRDPASSACDPERDPRDVHLLLSGKAVRIRALRRYLHHSRRPNLADTSRSHLAAAIDLFAHSAPVANHHERPSDADCWATLRSVGLDRAVRSLDDSVDEGGSNFSTGERQLLCLARALLAQRNIYLLDEFSASVDEHTDKVVHDTVLSLPATVIEICHRLRHIPRFDLVVVLDQGKVKEVGHPSDLLDDPTSALAALMRSSQ